MAEVFGAAAGGLGVVSLALQLGQAVVKLQKLCRDIKNLPKEVKNDIRDLEIYSRLLEVVGRSQTATKTSIPPSVLDDCLAHCRCAVDELSLLLNDSQSAISKRKPLASFRAVLKKDALHRHWETVTKAKCLVMDAYQICREEGRRDAHRNIMAQQTNMLSEIITVRAIVSSLSTNVVPSQHTPIGLPRTQVLGAMPSSQVVKSGNNKHYCSSPMARSSYEWSVDGDMVLQRCRIARVRAGLPHWLKTTVWEFSVYRTLSGWDTSFRVCYPLLEKQTLFDACGNGDLQGVQRLLASGQVSVHDKDYHGYTTLEIVLYTFPNLSHDGYVPLCHFLLEQNVLFDGYIGLYIPVTHPSSFEVIGDAINEIRKLLMSFITSSNCQLKYLPDFQGPLSDFVELLDNFWPLDQPLSREERASRVLNAWGDFKVLNAWSPRRHRFRPAEPPLSHHFETALQQSGWSVQELCTCPSLGRQRLDCAITNLAVPLSLENVPCALRKYNHDLRELNESILGSRNLVATIARAVGFTSLSFQDGGWIHCIRGFIDTFFARFNVGSRKINVSPLGTCGGYHKYLSPTMHWSRAQSVMQVFAQELKTMGVDLSVLGESVTITFSTAKLKEFNLERNFARQVAFVFGSVVVYRLIAVSYGPRLEDWKTYWSNPFDEWAGDFWEMLEHPEWRMPGAWDHTILVKRWQPEAEPNPPRKKQLRRQRAAEKAAAKVEHSYRDR